MASLTHLLFMRMARTAISRSATWMVPRESSGKARYRPFGFTLQDRTKMRSYTTTTQTPRSSVGRCQRKCADVCSPEGLPRSHQRTDASFSYDTFSETSSSRSSSDRNLSFSEPIWRHSFRIARHPIQAPDPHFDYRGDVIASNPKRLRFWNRLRRAPMPVRAHSLASVGCPDSA